MRNFLAEELRQFDDPRFLGVSVTAAELSPDLKYARVFWSVFCAPSPGQAARGVNPSATAVAAVQQALDGIAPALKRRVASELGLRFTPKLTFAYDPTLETSARIEMLMRDAAER